MPEYIEGGSRSAHACSVDYILGLKSGVRLPERAFACYVAANMCREHVRESRGGCIQGPTLSKYLSAEIHRGR